MTTPHTPDSALATVLAGAARAQAGAPLREHTSVEVRNALSRDQNPFAVVIGCSDSRVPMEHVLDAGYGDLFIIRTAGHVVDDTLLGSVEFALDELGVPLLMVLGHTSCGAVTAAARALDSGALPGAHLTSLVERILPSVIADRRAGGRTVDSAVASHVRRSVHRLRELSPLTASAEATGDVLLVGAVYDLGTGGVTLLDRPLPGGPTGN